MADIEYSDVYSVYMTDSGVRYLTNKTSIEIMKMLFTKEMTVTDLSEILGESKSSLQSNMMKLVRLGMVSSTIDPTDKRKVIYYATSSLMLCPVSTDTIDKSVLGDLIGKTIVADDGYSKNHLVLAMLMPYMMGVSIHPLLVRTSCVMASHCMSRFNKFIDDEFMTEFRKCALKAGLPYIDMDIGREIKVYVDSSGMTKSEIYVMHSVVLGLAMRMIYLKTGTWYTQIRYEYTEGKVIIYLSKYIGDQKRVDYFMSMISHKKSDDDWPFAILSKDNKTTLYGNRTQIKIIDALQKANLSLKELSDMLDVPAVTVHLNLMKLLESGAIAVIDDFKSKLVTYRMRADVLVTPGIKTHFSYVQDSVSDDGRFIEMLYKHLIFSFRDAGVNLRNILGVLGAEVAKIWIKKNPGATAEQFLSIMESLNMGTGCKVKVVSYIPLKLSISNDNYHALSEFMAPMFESAAITALKMITGVEYSVEMIIE